jgi:hypothetical protein|tara:strand:- start:4991 stop:5683 length:693 start_codon:yes stop_codon:yes gene_type:complete
MEQYHTLYEWCLLNNIRPLQISDDDKFMTDEIYLDDFKNYLEDGDYKENSVPRKPEKYLELRMYGLVPYNLSPIQQGIQFNHANDNFRALPLQGRSEYMRFITEWKTNILLNGGTSNEGHMVSQGFQKKMYIGTMQQHQEDLLMNKIDIATFYEPDLNSMLTAIAFLVDERVFNKKLYPNFEPSPYMGDTSEEMVVWSKNNEKQYASWVTKIGGPKNEFLRDFLSDKRLA